MRSDGMQEHGEDAGVSPRARSPSKHRSPATATRGSARSPHPLGRTCPQSHHPRHVSPAVVRPTQSPHHHSPAPSSNLSPKKLPKPFPFNKLLPDVLRSLGRLTPRSPRRNSPAPTIKVPQLPRLRENVHRLPVDLRLLLKDSLQLLQQRKALIQFTGTPEKDGPETVLDQEAQGTPELKDEVLDRSSISAPLLRTRHGSITSDYFSDSGEPSLSPSLIKDHEFVLHLDLVDEESQSSRTPSRAPSRVAVHSQDEEHEADLPLEEFPPNPDRFLKVLVPLAGENGASVEEGELICNPQANLSAKQDFPNLVPETRLCSSKSPFGFSSSPLHISLAHQHIHGLRSTPPSPPPPTAPPLTSHGAKACRGETPAAPWHPFCESLNTSTGKLVDDVRITAMDNDKGCSSNCGGVGGLGPLSFSLSSLSGSSSPVLDQVSPARTAAELHTNSLNRRKTKRCNDREEARRSWGPADKEEGNRDFWASIQEPYNYIMGSNLIPDSYQVGETAEAPSSGEFELCWDSGDVSPPYVWSFSEFLDQYNELYEWLIQVQLKLYSHSNPPDKAARMAQQEELRRRTYRRKLFVEQGERVAQRYPGSSEEISWRVNYLNNKWDQLESNLTPAKGRNQEVEVELDLAHEEGILRRWLSDMEDQIQPLTCRLPRGSSLLTLQDRYKDNQVRECVARQVRRSQILLKDIEAHGPVLKSVVRQYERIAAAAASAPPSSPSPTPASGDRAGAAPQDPLTAPGRLQHPRRGTKDNIPRKARSLEKRWHQIYLRSLEWHYYLEGVIANFKEPQSTSGSESEDEPVSKLRRLSTSSASCGSTSGSSCPPSPRPAARHYTRRARTLRWSAADDSSLSEAGSYIEPSPAVTGGSHTHAQDDYVCVTGTPANDSASPPPCLGPEPMVIEPDQHKQGTTDSTSSPDCDTPDGAHSIGSSSSSASGNQDPVMVGSVGLNTVRARCGELTTSPDILADVNMIHNTHKSSTADITTEGEMENMNQVNGNTVVSSPATTEDSGLNLSSSLNEGSGSSEISGVRDSPSKTSCTNVERPSPNCAIFDFKHQDTDTEEAATNTHTSTATAACQANLNLVEGDPAKNRLYQVRRRSSTLCRESIRTRLEFSCDEEVDHDALQKIIDTAVPEELDWLNSNMSSDNELSGTEEEVMVHEHMDTGSDGGTPGQQQAPRAEQQPTQYPEAQRSISKESLNLLVSGAERLVREPIEGDEPPPVVSPRPHLQLQLNASLVGAAGSKQARVKQWIASQRREARLSASCVQDSCDASGELTTGESDVESASSDDMDASTATQRATSTKGSLRGSRDPLPSTDNTPTTERMAFFPSLQDSAQPKVVLRNRKRRSGEQRPLSVSELTQLAARLDQTPTSVSETALHCLLSATPDTPTNDNQAFGATTTSTTTTTTPGTTSTTSTTSPTSTSDAAPSSTPPKTTIALPSPATAASLATMSNSTTITTNIASTGRISPSSFATGSLRRKKTRARRKSNLSLGRRTDSGSEGIALNLSGGSDHIQVSPTRRFSKSHSSGSDTCSHSRRQIVKSSSFSVLHPGGCRAGSGGMTSSTEKCVSDCGAVLGVPRTPTRRADKVCYSSDDSRCASPEPIMKELQSTRSPAHTARSLTQSDQDGPNTHEDMSSLSEQAWDNYQEYKYLSEPYSEDIDQDAARRLLEFGDDYRKYIDSDGASSFSGVPHRGRRTPPHRRLRSLAPSGPRDLDSDSDLDDLHHVIDQSRSQLTVTENVLKKYSSEAGLGLDYAEIVATTETNIRCLMDILPHLEMDGSLEPELEEVQSIVQRWEVLQAQAVERQRQSSQVRELQRQVKTLRLSLEALGKHASELTKADDIDSRVKLIQKLQEAKALQLEVSARKTEVSSINLAVHRFLTETGYSLASLKDDVADLYRLWDEADRRVSSEVSRLENVDAAWKLWESQAEELTKMLRQDSDTLRVLDVAIQTGSMTDTTTASMQGVARLLNEKRKTQPGKKFLLQHTKTQSVDIQGSSLSLTASGDECLSDSGTSGYESCSSEELSERERRLANLRRLARDLEASLHPNSQAWAAICKTLSSAEAELKGLQQHCRELVVRSSETLDQAKTSPQLRRRMWSKDCKVGKACRRSNTVSGSGRGGSRRGWVWRVVRAALPFQAALLLLFCVACLLEPNCCDHVNTLNLSLSPQLRYVHGPPPV
ncbi:serine-rich adhesin for platelets-like isoform X5 [Scylla paramamosain]|uniref:serine-rich adhesin for platelets-like isoform X5 n=1 Tax=Scylla paramamosain TaxID=85552 RepID=UPI003083C25C